MPSETWRNSFFPNNFSATKILNKQPNILSPPIPLFSTKRISEIIEIRCNDCKRFPKIFAELETKLEEEFKKSNWEISSLQGEIKTLVGIVLFKF